MHQLHGKGDCRWSKRVETPVSHIEVHITETPTHLFLTVLLHGWPEVPFSEECLEKTFCSLMNLNMGAYNELLPFWFFVNELHLQILFHKPYLSRLQTFCGIAIQGDDIESLILMLMLPS